MKVLLSAYACEPDKGSEPGIGWEWAVKLSERPGIDVTVLTRANNRQAIEDAIAKSDRSEFPKFIYYDLPPWLQKLKKRSGSIYPYYLLWCFGVRKQAGDIVDREQFDLFHHLTFSTDWLPSSIPSHIDCATVIGPLGGYNTNPAIAKLVPSRYRLQDFIRKVIRKSGLYFRKRELRRCDTIIANNSEFAATYRGLAPNANIATVSTQLSSGPSQGACEKRHSPSNAEKKKILLAGRLLYWKGLDAALEALSILDRRSVHFDVTIVGNGPSDYVSRLFAQVQNLGLNDRLEFIDHLPRQEFLKLMIGTDIFLYPSLYATADSIMIESLELSVPIVCFPSSGAFELLGHDYPYISTDFTAQALADQVERADRNSKMYQEARSHLLLHHAPANKLTLIEEAYRCAVQQSRSRGGVIFQNA